MGPLPKPLLGLGEHDSGCGRTSLLRRGELALQFPEPINRDVHWQVMQLVLDLDILAAALASPVFPPPEAVLRLEDIILEASVPLDEQLESTRYDCEFALSAEPAFDPRVLISSVSPSQSGRCGFVPAPLPLAADPAGADRPIYYWRARAVQGASAGPWSLVRSFRLTSESGSTLPPSGPGKSCPCTKTRSLAFAGRFAYLLQWFLYRPMIVLKLSFSLKIRGKKLGILIHGFMFL